MKSKVESSSTWRLDTPARSRSNQPESFSGKHPEHSWIVEGEHFSSGVDYHTHT